MSNFDILKNILDAQQDTSTKAYDTTATVRRIEGSTAWVHIPGGVDETPVRLTINAKAGDTVQLRVGGGSAWLVGNATAPPTDDTKADAAQVTANSAKAKANTAHTVAKRAKKIADNTNQYFWMASEGTDTGAHITEVTQEEFLADPDNGGGNLLARSNGIAIRDGMTELAAFSADGLELGNAYGYKVKIGRHLVDFASIMKIGAGRTTETFTGDGTTYSFFCEGWIVSFAGDDITVTVDGTEITEGFTVSNLSASGLVAHLLFDTAPDDGAVIKITYYDGTKSYAAVGGHANPPKAGDSCFVIGYNYALGARSMAQGTYCYAKDKHSVAFGLRTISASPEQIAMGRYNIEDADDTYAFIIGNGTRSTARSNALTVDWDGNVEIAGDVSAVDISASGALSVTGDTTLSGALSVTGDVTSDGQIKSTTETYSLTLPSAVYFGGGLVRNGGIAMLSIINISKLPAGNTTICTLPEGWRPPISVMRRFEAPNNSLGTVGLFINSSGVVTLYNYGSAISSASNISDTITYVLA